MARQVHKNIVWSYLSLAAGTLSPLILIPLFTRLLGHELYGEYVVITSISYYIGLANLGIGQTVANRIAEAVAKRDDEQVATLVSTAFYSLAAVVGPLIIVLFVATPWLWPLLVGSPDRSAKFAFLVIFGLGLISFPFKAQSMMLRGYQRIDREQGIWVLLNLLRIAGIAAVLLSGLKLAAVATVYGVVVLLGGIASYLLAAQISPAAHPVPGRFSWRLLRGMVVPSVAFLMLQISSTLATRIDNVVIGYVLGATAVTSYSVPYRLLLMVILLFSILQSALQPTITAHYARDNRPLLRQAYSFLMRLAMFYAVAAAVALWLVGPLFIRLWAGHGIYPGGLVFGLQIIFAAVQIMMAPAEMILWSTSRHHTWAVIALVEGVLNLGLSIWWAHPWGLAGVIGASIVARAVTSAWYIPIAASTIVGMSMRHALRRMAPGVALAAVTLAAMWLIWTVAAPSSPGVAIGFAAALMIAFTAAFGWLVFTAEERRVAIDWILPAFSSQGVAQG